MATEALKRTVTQQRIAIAACVVLVGLLVANVATYLDNQSDRPATSPVDSSHNLVSAAKEHNHRKIFGGSFLYYLLEEEIPGAKLKLPPMLKWHHRRLQTISRLAVTIEDHPRLSLTAVRKRWPTIRTRGFVFVHRKRSHTIGFIFDENESEYVIVPTKHGKTRWLLLPESTYRQAAAEDLELTGGILP